jgi:hypothetical protein
MDASVIGDFFGSFAGGATSGVTSAFGLGFGLLGSWLKGREERKKREFDALEAARNRQHQLDVIRFEADNALKIEAAKTDRDVKMADLEGLTEAVKADSATYIKGWSGKTHPFVSSLIALGLGTVDVIRGLTRPLITSYLVYEMSRMWRDAVTKGDMVLASIIAQQVLFLAGVAVGWWFGSRGQSEPIPKTKPA